MDGVERNVHRDEEERTLHVLDALRCRVRVEKQQNCKQGRDACCQQLHIRCLRQTKQVEEIPPTKKSKLVAETCLNTATRVKLLLVELFNSVMDLVWVVPERGVLVAIDEGSDEVVVLLLDLVFVQMVARLVLLVQLDRLDRHHGHEEVSRVAQLRAHLANAAEVVDREARFVEVNDLTACQQHQPVEHFKDVGVGLMDSRDDCASLLLCQVSKNLHHTCGCE